MSTGRLYAVLFRDGVVKLGVSSQIIPRWIALSNQYGAMVSCVASPRIDMSPYRAEQWLLQRADKCFLRHKTGRELFVGDFGHACTLLRQAHKRYATEMRGWRAYIGAVPFGSGKHRRRVWAGE